MANETANIRGNLLATTDLPFETNELRRLLEVFLNLRVTNPITNTEVQLANYKFGVYCFYDYDGEPIYVGQTTESLRTRIRRHLTNQRTDAVAMSVLDPFEVCTVKVYPLPQLEGRRTNDPEVKKILDALEYRVYMEAIRASRFAAILNEKKPPSVPFPAGMEIPSSFEGPLVSDAVRRIREHPDIRIARRTRTIQRLAQVISERKVQKGLREVLLTQSKRLQWLAQARVDVDAGPEDEADEED